MNKNEKIEYWKDRLFESLYYNRIAEARKYCKQILDYGFSKSYSLMYNRLEALKKENGRYQALDTLELKLRFINSILKFETSQNKLNLCYDQRFIDFCYTSLKKSGVPLFFTEGLEETLDYLINIPPKEDIDFSEFENVLRELLKRQKTHRIFILFYIISLIALISLALIFSDDVIAFFERLV